MHLNIIYVNIFSKYADLKDVIILFYAFYLRNAENKEAH